MGVIMATSNEPASHPGARPWCPNIDHAGLAARLRLVRAEVAGEGGVGTMARSLGVPERSWGNFEAGVAIPGHVLLAFLVVTAVEPRWLLMGVGPRYRGDLGGTGRPASSLGA